MKTIKTILGVVLIAITSIIFQSCNSNDDNGETNQCELAQVDKTNAQTAYDQDNTNETLCNAYKTALQNEITICGDTDGTLQDIVDNLGDCTTSNSNAGDLSVTAGTLNIDFSTNSAVLESGSGIITVNGNKQDQGANYFIYFEIAENTTGVDAIQNFKLTLNKREYFPNTNGFNDFTSNITVNSSGTIQGTFGGIVSSTDGADLNLSKGVIGLTY